jgi:hypothetical protein
LAFSSWLGEGYPALAQTPDLGTEIAWVYRETDVSSSSSSILDYAARTSGTAYNVDCSALAARNASFVGFLCRSNTFRKP